MNLTHKANTLSTRWDQISNIHYSKFTNFDNAIDIEIEIDATHKLVYELRLRLLANDTNSSELLFLINAIEDHLNILSGSLTFEILKNGITE
jgi:hypothetical protein